MRIWHLENLASGCEFMSDVHTATPPHVAEHEKFLGRTHMDWEQKLAAPSGYEDLSSGFRVSGAELLLWKTCFKGAVCSQQKRA